MVAFLLLCNGRILREIMVYTGFEMRRIIQECESVKDVVRVANTVWEDSPSFLDRSEMAWFNYCINKRATELQIAGKE